LRRNALKEREQQRPPRAYREIFKVLRDLEADLPQEESGVSPIQEIEGD